MIWRDSVVQYRVLNIPLLVIMVVAMLGLQPVQGVQAGTLSVDTLVDEVDGSCSDGDCSLRDAINAATAGDSIKFTVSGTITIDLGPIDIDKNLNILGTGTSSLIIDGDGSDILTIDASVTDLYISSMTFTNADGVHGGVVNNSGIVEFDHVVFSGNEADFGGALHNEASGNMTLSFCTVTDNYSSVSGAGIENKGILTVYRSNITGNTADSGGGGIHNYGGEVTVTQCTISGNTALRGGGISNLDGILNVYTSTISGNTTSNEGAGIHTKDGPGNESATTTIEQSTITDNTGQYTGGIYNEQGTGGTTVTNLKNTLVAGNHKIEASGFADCRNFLGTLVSLDYNLMGEHNGCTLSGGHDSEIVDPLLDPLANNGGFSETHALQAGSPALNQIPDGVNGCGTTYDEDQRGMERPQGTHCDIGSFEGEAPANLDNVGFYVPGSYRWYLKTGIDDGWAGVISFGWGGVSELMPVTGDWDGDGVDTAAFYKPSQWRWYLKNDQNDGWAGTSTFQWGGNAELIPIAGDWDGDGDDTVGFFKPADSEWYLKDDNTGGWSGFTTVVFGGAAGNIPIVGDWDGDGDDTIGFYVPSQNKWWLKNDLVDGWAGVTGFNFGTTDPMDPVTGDWNGDGIDTVGGYVSARWSWFLKGDQMDGWSNVTQIRFGVTADYEALAGDWQ